MCSEPVTFGGGMTMREGFGARLGVRTGAKSVGLVPFLGDLRFDRGGIIGFVEHFGDQYLIVLMMRFVNRMGCKSIVNIKKPPRDAERLYR